MAKESLLCMDLAIMMGSFHQCQYLDTHASVDAVVVYETVVLKLRQRMPLGTHCLQRLALFASLVERMGSLVRVVTEIMKDLRYFFILIATIFGGFAFAFSVQLGGGQDFTFTGLQLFSTMTGDFEASMLMDVLYMDQEWCVLAGCLARHNSCCVHTAAPLLDRACCQAEACDGRRRCIER